MVAVSRSRLTSTSSCRAIGVAVGAGHPAVTRVAGTARPPPPPFPPRPRARAAPAGPEAQEGPARPLGGKSLGGGATDPPAPAGDEHDLAGEPRRHRGAHLALGDDSTQA